MKENEIGGATITEMQKNLVENLKGKTTRDTDVYMVG